MITWAYIQGEEKLPFAVPVALVEIEDPGHQLEDGEEITVALKGILNARHAEYWGVDPT